MKRKPAPPPLTDDAPASTLELGDTVVKASKFTFADAERLTRESAAWPLPVFERDAARKAIEANGFRCDEVWRKR